MLLILGIVIVFGSVAGGYLMHGGSLLALNQPSEFIIIGGAWHLRTRAVELANRRRHGRDGRPDDAGEPTPGRRLGGSSSGTGGQSDPGAREHAARDARHCQPGVVQVTSEGLRIELQETREDAFFDSGSARLKPRTEQLLALIGKELAPLDHGVILEGHTDSRPYGTIGYSNWELSTDRANAARRAMEAAGLPPRLIRTVRGFADTALRTPDQPFDSRNRRVSIVVPASAGLSRPTLAPSDSPVSPSQAPAPSAETHP